MGSARTTESGNTVPGGYLYLLRHGQSTYNRDNRFAGWADAPLTEQGRAEMEAAGKLLAGRRIDLAFSSNLSRTRDSAAIALRAAHLEEVPLRATKNLNERRYGDLEGVNRVDAAERFGADQVHVWRRSFTATPPGGESLAVAAARIMGFFEETIRPELRDGKHVFICAHGNTIRAIVRVLDGLTDEELMHVEIPTGGLLRYRFDRSGAVTGKERVTSNETR